MSMPNTTDLKQQLTGRKFATIVGLAGIAAIHLMDLPGKFAETPYLGVAYLGMIGAALFLIERLVRHSASPKAARLEMLAAAGLAASVFAGFVVNRTVGMPGAMGDIGNWFEPLGFLSLFVEAFTVWQALAAAKLLKNFGTRQLDDELQALTANRDYVLTLG